MHRVGDGPNNGVINFGGFDASRISGGTDGLNFNPVVSTNGLWSITLDNVFVGGTAVGLTARTVVIDTGTSLILIPAADALKFHQLIPGTRSNGETFYIRKSKPIKTSQKPRPLATLTVAIIISLQHQSQS